MRLEGVAVLAAPTPRSQAYVQALVASQFLPDQVITMGAAVSDASVDAAARRVWNGIQLPSLDEPITTTCKSAGIPVISCDATDVNAEEVVSAVGDVTPKIVIYSGYGGQIVGEEMLDSGGKFLHLHSGWLPGYRGSTTLYYALLHGEDPGVTALILDRNIDTGAIVARRYYPKPPRGMDIDRVYDAAIRADLLVKVMSAYARDGYLPELEQQTRDEGTTYYVIHPVLKHLAILALEPA